tara:strand:+ start:884 stop:1978 length:1095 start_codon:yes stop_codon:yes gene_type:complete
MIRTFIINKYITKKFLLIIFNISASFFFLGFVINLFEEINFFKDYGTGINLPILLTAMILPSLLYDMFPFIVFLAGIWLFWKIKKNDEIIALKVSGLSNFSIIAVPSVLSIILGIFFVTAFNPVSSALVKKYESIKGTFYEKEQDYLAAVTDNGIWIKETNHENYNIIRSHKLKNDNLSKVTIYTFDNDNNFIKRIDADSADISSSTWVLKNVEVSDKDGQKIAENISSLSYKSLYDIKKIKSLYSNLDTISFWALDEEIKILEERGYSTNEMRAKLQRSFAFPLFLLSMLLLSGVFTLGTQLKESNWSYVFIAIIASVLIFYFNDFSAALGKTDKLPIEVSVWMPIVIIFIFSSVGLIHANQK